VKIIDINRLKYCIFDGESKENKLFKAQICIHFQLKAACFPHQAFFGAYFLR
jgi:hypothetical protein